MAFTKIHERGYEGRLTDDYVCLHADAKPTDNMGNGDSALEMDTGDVYVFDADNTTWRNI